jgi:hypothetical protein
VDVFGNLYIAETYNETIRKVAAASNAAGAATTTVLSASANPAAPASPLTLTATVTATLGNSTPTGSVAFYAGSLPLGMAELNSSGVAGYTISSLPLGTYGITAFYGGDANNQSSASAPFSETIQASAAVSALTSLSPSSATAGGSAFTLTVTGSSFASTSAILWNGSSRTTNYVSSTRLQATITAADIAAAGNATVTVSTPAPGGGTSNGLAFDVISSGARATPVLSWPGAGAITYGANLSGVLPTSASYNGSPVTGTFSYMADGAAVTTSTVLNAGAHTLAATFTPTDTADYAVVLGSAMLMVNPASLTVTAPNQSMTYGGTVPALTCSVSGAVNADSFTCSATTTVNPAAAGSPFAIVPVALGPAIGNYTVTVTDGTLTVNKATLTVTAQNTVMFAGDPLPTLMTYTLTGFVNGDTDCAVTGDPAISTNATSASGPGSYPITVSQGSLASANYTFTFVEGTLTVGTAQ